MFTINWIEQRSLTPSRTPCLSISFSTDFPQGLILQSARVCLTRDPQRPSDDGQVGICARGKDKCQKWGGKPSQQKTKVFARISYVCRLITHISQVSIIDFLPLCKCIFHLLSPEPSMRPRETAPSPSAQAPGLRSSQSSQGIAKSARMLAWCQHKRELERFCVAMSLGQGVSSISVSQ